MLGKCVEEQEPAAEQDRDLVQDDLVDQPGSQRGGDGAAAHDADILAAGKLAGDLDRLFDGGGDRLRRMQVRHGPVGQYDERRVRVRTAVAEMTGVFVRRPPADHGAVPAREFVEDPGALRAQLEPVAEHLAWGVTVEVPVEQHAGIAETAAELVGALRRPTTDVAVDRDGESHHYLAHGTSFQSACGKSKKRSGS